MDIVLFAILAFYFARGCWKGFLSMIFSFVGVFFVTIISWKLAESFLPTIENFVGEGIFATMKSFIDGILPGNFSSLDEFQLALSNSRIGMIFGLFVTKLLGNITFDGTLSAGQILAPTLTTLVLTGITFLLIFIFLQVLLKFLRFLLNKIIKKCGLSPGNRILGGIVGLFKGLFVFGIVFVLISISANVLLNEWLLQFLKSGPISNFLYENLLTKLLNLIY